MRLDEAIALAHEHGGHVRRGLRVVELSAKDKNKPRLLADVRGNSAPLWHDDVMADDWEHVKQ